MTKAPKRIPLTQGQYALIDEEDFDLVNKYKWCAGKITNGNGYTAMSNGVINGKLRSFRMHSLIMKFPKTLVVDHINHNTLDNRRTNLRLCTKQQNRFNSMPHRNSKSGYKGVTWHSTENGRYGYWRVRFRVSGKSMSFGCFKDLQEAVAVYQKEIGKYHGKYKYAQSK